MKVLKSRASNLKREKSPLWLDVLFLLICIVFSYLKPVPFPWKVPLIAIAIITYVYFFYKRTNVIGLGKIRWKNTILWGFVLAIVIVVGISNIFNPLIERILNKEVDTSSYGELVGNFKFLKDYWWKAIISAAIAEEIFYRGFTFYVLEKLIGNSTYQKIFIVLISSVYFGLSHSYQGITGVIGIIVAAILFGSGYYLNRKNLYALILAHALVDTWSLFSLYKGGISLFF